MNREFKHGRSGYQKHGCKCDVCHQAEIAYKRRYRMLHRDKLNEQENKLRRQNREKYREMDRKRYDDNPEIREKKRLYHNTESQKIYRRNYRESHRDEMRAHQKMLFSFDPEKFKIRTKKWRDENREQYRKICREYLRKRRLEPSFRLEMNLRGRIRKAIRRGMKRGCSIDLIGCSIVELRNHLENRFKTGMFWDNYGKWHVDHIRPCSSFDLTDIDQQKICFNWKNLQPLWAVENYKKSDKVA